MMKRNLQIPILIKLSRISAYDIFLALMFGAAIVAAALEPPTAYLLPLAVAAWILLWVTLKRESSPRYRRTTDN